MSTELHIRPCHEILLADITPKIDSIEGRKVKKSDNSK
jgi:hypothetical protein